MLFVLFLARTAMAFQFQSVGALSPMLRAEFDVGLADIGLLIGLYFAPGLALALPGGALGRRYGDKPVVLLGLGLMVVGGVLMTVSPAWGAQIAGRLFAGVGGILLNVLMSKMIADWFAGKEISLAMALFLNSWPLGIALALIFLPMLALSGGLELALGVIAGVTMVGFLVMAAFYRAPAEADAPKGAPGGKLRGPVLWAVITAASIWGLYNVALSMAFSFGPELFVDRGWPVAEAGSITSIILWLLAVSSPIGGLVVEWTKRRDAVLVFGNLAFALFMLLAASSGQVLLMVILIGAASGLAVGSMMSLPATALAPDQRALGMGVFFTVFYFFSFTGPALGGWLAELTGDIGITFEFGAVSLVASTALLIVYHRLMEAHGLAKSALKSSPC